MFDLANPHSIISNHINHYFSLSTNRNHHPPSFSPILQYPISQTTHFLLLIPFIINHSIINRLMDYWFPNRNCLILCFHWVHFFCWQGILFSILIVWNQWMNGRGKESWSGNSNNNSSCSKQWTNNPTNNSINNRNLQYKTISNPSNWRWITTINLSMHSKATTNCLHFHLFFILYRFTHIHSFGLFDIGMHSWYLLILTYRVILLFNQS